jgi:hypothetical protein
MKPKDSRRPQGGGKSPAASGPAGPFTLRWTESANGHFEAIQANPADPGLAKQVRKALRFLAANPRHPSLRTHLFHSVTGPDGERVFEAYAQNDTAGAYRIFFHYGPGAAVITIIAITEHP